jgi:hypothetical protein
MAKTPNPYTRLPGRGVRRAVIAIAATRCSLWLGADHLLAVDATVASEEYRRFYFRDIEAFVIRQTARRQITNWVMFALLLATTVPFAFAWRSDGATGWLVTAAIFTAFWLTLILVNTLFGATCETKVRTAVQFEPLPSLSRLPNARKVLARLAPLITAAQGAATPEEISAAPWMTPDATRQAAATAIRHEKGTLHYVLFALLLADAASTVAAYGFLRSSLSTIVTISTIITMLGTLVCVTAVMRQGDTDLPAPARVVAKSALLFYILSFAAGFVFTFIYAFHHPGGQVRTGLEFINEPGFETTATIAAGIAAVLGLAGFAAMRAPRPPAA